MMTWRAALVVAGLGAITACGGSASDGDDAVGTTTGATSGATAPEVTVDAAASATTDAAADTTTTKAAPTTTTTAAPRPSVGDALMIEAAVDLRALEAAAFSPIVAPTPVAVGDVLRTDVLGYAEIAYFDGSRTRLDVDTEFEVLELVDDAGESTARTRMGVGRTWHRVESLGETDGGFSVETSVATATVRGTAFSIECRSTDACRFVVVEGTIEVELLDGTVVELVAPASLDVSESDGAGTPVALPFDPAFGEDWLFDNALRDRDAGFPGPGQIYEAHGPAYAGITGAFTGQRTITEATCVAVCLPTSPPVGDVAERTYTFDLDCTSGVPCTGTVQTQYVHEEQLQQVDLPLVFDGTAYTWGHSYTSANCMWDDDGNGTVDRRTGQLDTTITWTMTPTAAEVRDDRWYATALEGGAVADNAVVDDGGCDGYLGNHEVSVISVVR